jgi:glycosyltransferase involved in cell wall biosynthesis
MKICMVSCQHLTSGIGNYSIELAQNIRALNPQIEFYKLYKKGHPDEGFFKHDWIKPIHYKSFKNLHPYVLPFFIRKAITPPSATLFHAHWFLSGLALTYAMNRPCVVTMHDVSLLHIREANKRYEAYYKWAIDRFRLQRIPMIVVSNSAKDDAIKYAHYPEHLIQVVPNGINDERYFPLYKEKKDRFTIIYSGGLGKRKNVDLLLNAYKVLEEKYDHVELKLAGAYPERTAYPDIAKSLGLKRVTFTGYVPDAEMNRFYNSGDLLIYTSLYEGFGFAPLEAMAAGVPVLATAGGALKEISGGGAQLIDYDPNDIVEKASILIEHEQDRQALIERGKSWVKQYSWENAAKRTYEVYEAALKQFSK